MSDRQFACTVAAIVGFVLMATVLLLIAIANRPHPYAYFQTCEQGAYLIGRLIYQWKCQ